MDKAAQNMTDAECVKCKRTVKAVHEDKNWVVISAEHGYKEAISDGHGMYCPNCDHVICLACIPTAQNAEAIIEKVAANDQGRRLIDEMRQKGQIIVNAMQCFNCGANFGQLEQEKGKFIAEIANKITEGSDDLTLDEIFRYINDIQVFGSRLNQRHLLSETVEKLGTILELTINKTAFPRLKQVILQYIDDKQYDEARELCDWGTQWNGYLKEKGRWEDDLKQIETLMEMSKITAGQKKIIEGGPRKIVTVRAADYNDKQSKSEVDRAKELIDQAKASRQNGDHRSAADLYGKAIEIYEKLDTIKEQTEMADKLAFAYANKANALSDLGDNPGALELQGKSIAIYERLVNKEGRSHLSDNLCSVYVNEATELVDMGDHAGAVASYGKAAQILEKMSDSEEKTEIADRLAGIYMNQGIAWMGLGDNDTARHLFGMTIEILERLVNSEGRKDLLNSLAMVYLNMGTVVAKLGDSRDGLEWFEKSIEIRERLIKNEGRTELLNELALVYRNKAGALIGLNEFSTAVEFCDKAMAIVDGLINTKGRAELKGDFIHTKVTKALALDMMNETEKAKEIAREVVPELREEIKRSGGANLRVLLDALETNFAHLLEG